jgi:hypothetical protein
MNKFVVFRDQDGAEQHRINVEDRSQSHIDSYVKFLESRTDLERYTVSVEELDA